MATEHNPIAVLISQIQQNWNKEASPYISQIKLFRWLIKPDEMQLYEGYLKLESSEHGSIPEVLVAMLTPFKDSSSYSTNLISDWVKNFDEDTKTKEELKANGRAFEWDHSFFTQPNSSISHEQHFLNMLTSFYLKLIGKEKNLVVALFPHSISDNNDFCLWLTSLIQCTIPREISFLIFDLIGDNNYEDVCKRFPEVTKSLHVNLDLDGAVNKIIKSGNPNSVEYKLRECIVEMGNAVQNDNIDKLNNWGQRALEVTQKSGLKSAYSSAHIIYAGMLFNFKKYIEIDSLLQHGLNIARRGVEVNDEACKPLIIQFYGFMAASLQLQNKLTEAITAYSKQGDMAIEFSLSMMALTPYQQAYLLSKKNLPDKFPILIQKAFETGMQLSNEEQQSSNLKGIAFDYLQMLEESNQFEQVAIVNSRMVELFGVDWKNSAQEMSAFNFNSKKTTA